MRDRIEELALALQEREELDGICIRSFKRPETLAKDETSIVIIPLGPPIPAARGSDTTLSKSFLYQVNVEASSYLEPKRLQAVVEEVFESLGFYQTDGGLDEFINELNRYVDARTYQGHSRLYEKN